MALGPGPKWAPGLSGPWARVATLNEMLKVALEQRQLDFPTTDEVRKAGSLVPTLLLAGSDDGLVPRYRRACLDERGVPGPLALSDATPPNALSELLNALTDAIQRVERATQRVEPFG